MACLPSQGGFLRDRHSIPSRQQNERIPSRGIVKLGRREGLGGRNCVPTERSHVQSRNGSSRLQVRAGFEDLASNQVIVSAAAASALGQLAKPFAAALSGKGFNWKLVVKSGGMPSSHSATVTAVATALAFERGLADGVFGLSVILASVVMYDAQGVRNAVGKHAKVLNTMLVSGEPLPQAQVQEEVEEEAQSVPAATAIGAELARDPVESELAFMDNTSTPSSPGQPAASSVATLEAGASPSASYLGTPLETGNGSYTRSGRFFELAEQLPSMKVGEVDIQELGNQEGWRLLPLKESIGHTKLEVLVGGVWGVLITFVFHAIYFPSN